MYRFRLRYWYATYTGSMIIIADDEEEAIALLWQELNRHAPICPAYQSVEVLSCDLTEEDIP